jgi:hypothetical protein
MEDIKRIKTSITDGVVVMEVEFLYSVDYDKAYQDRKGHLKRRLIQVIADQSGKLFDPNKIIVVWARRFAEYKRADLIRRDIARFNKLIQNSKHPVQIVWAGKPYPGDTGAISVFNHLVKISKKEPNLDVLTCYELTLSGLLKTGADVWLNTPRRPREASGTSGMTAAMNGAVNLSISDGWIPEFAKHGENSFVLPVVDLSLNHDEQDNQIKSSLIAEYLPFGGNDLGDDTGEKPEPTTGRPCQRQCQKLGQPKAKAEAEPAADSARGRPRGRARILPESNPVQDTARRNTELQGEAEAEAEPESDLKPEAEPLAEPEAKPEAELEHSDRLCQRKNHPR